MSAEAFLDAARAGDVGQLRAMLEADRGLLAAKNQLDQSAILLAKYHRKAEAVAFLLEQGPELTLHEAAAVGALERVKELVSGRARVIDSHSKDGFTPLSLAAFFGNAEVAEFLIDKGAALDLAATNPMKVAPIHAAVAGRDARIIRALVEAGANVNARQAHDFTPLHAAAQNGDVETVKLLLERGAERDARSAGGQSALDLAMLAGYATVVAVLEGA